MITLRPEQDAMVTEALAFARAGESTLCVAPTGFGKGDCIVETIKRALHGNMGPVAMCVHLAEIVRDTAERLRAAGVWDVGTIMGDEAVGCSAPSVYVVSFATLAARGLTLPVSLLVVDEAHRSKAATYEAALRRHVGVPMIGWTATGERGDGSGLGSVGYSRIVQGPQIAELVTAGKLAPIVCYGPEKDVDELSEDPVLAWVQYSRGMPGLIYAGSVPHSEALAARLTAAGYRAAHVDGTTPKGKRKEILRQFADGELDILCNFRLLVEGVNVPRAKVVMLASAFSHPGPYLQAIGRARRRFGDTTAILIDLRGNLHCHLLPDDPRQYYLEGAAIRGAGGTNELPAVQQCKKCLAWGRGQVCQNCGATKPPPPPPRMTRKELKEIRQANVARTGSDYSFFKSLVVQMKQNGWKRQWPCMVFRAHKRRWPMWTVESVEKELENG